MTQNNRTLPALLLALAATVGFFLLDMQGIRVGDDLCYMFTDSKLYEGDGKPVETIGDILTTQALHYNHTNGRVLVHSAVMLMTSFAGKITYCIINALMFGMLLLFSTRYAFRRAAGTRETLFMLLLLWTCLPQPGIVMLSLVSYAVNYLWSGTAAIATMLIWRRLAAKNQDAGVMAGLCIFAFAAGATQESFTLPLAAGMAIWLLANRRHRRIRQLAAFAAAYWTGTIAISAAPGNINRFLSGGGASGTGILQKLAALAPDLLYSPVTLLAAVTLIWLLADRRGCSRYLRRNILPIATIVASIALAALSYNARRQLFCPSLLSAILLATAVASHRRIMRAALGTPASIATAIAVTAIYAGAYTVRQFPREVMDSVEAQARQGCRIIYLDYTRPRYETRLMRALFRNYNDDITTGQLPLMFDGHTKTGLSRLYSPGREPGHITNFLPYPVDTIKKIARQAERCGNTIIPATLDDTYAVAATTGERIRRRGEGKLPYEAIIQNDTTYYIIPAVIREIEINEQRVGDKLLKDF